MISITILASSFRFAKDIASRKNEERRIEQMREKKVAHHSNTSSKSFGW